MENKYIEILNKWYDLNSTYNSNSTSTKINTDTYVPSSFPVFIYWLLNFSPRDLKYVSILAPDNYRIKFIVVTPQVINMSVFNMKTNLYVNSVSNYLYFNPHDTPDQIKNKLNNLSIDFYNKSRKRVLDTITYDDISKLFLNSTYYKLENKILKILSLSYKLNMIDMDPGDLAKVFMTQKLDKITIKASLKSDLILSKEEQDKYFLDRITYDNLFKRNFSEHCRFGYIIGRVEDIKSEYLLKMTNHVEVNLNITIMFYTEEYYYGESGYGYLESAIHNICRKGLGSSIKHIDKLAEQLYVDIEGKNHEDVCEILWTRFYNLTDEDFEHEI